MSPFPSFTVTERDSLPARTPPTATDTLFVLGVASRGPSDRAVLCRSIADLAAVFGPRSGCQALYDAADAAFRAGVARIQAARIIGPTPVKASANLLDQSGSAVPGDVALVATAVEHGTWANGLNVEVAATGSDFEIIVTHDTDGAIERSGLLADRAAAVTWAAGAKSIRLSLGASAEDPRTQAPVSLAGGTDDSGNITSTERKAALALFVRSLGPGQVAYPGSTISAVHGELLEHAKANNRWALLDLQDTAAVATITAALASLRASFPAFTRHGSVHGPWHAIPGLAPGTERIVPASVIEAGIIARLAAAGLDEGEAPAGVIKGAVRAALRVTQDWPVQADRDALYDAGFNIAINHPVYGVVAMGNRALADPAAEPLGYELAARRLIMRIRAEGETILERWVQRRVAGDGLELGDLKGDLKAMLAGFYDRRALYGSTPAEAFSVDTGPAVNTPQSLAEQKLKAVVGVRVSPNAEQTSLELVRAPITEEL